MAARESAVSIQLVDVQIHMTENETDAWEGIGSPSVSFAFDDLLDDRAVCQFDPASVGESDADTTIDIRSVNVMGLESVDISFDR